MALYLGIDTSNYTTSTALYNAQTGEMRQEKQLLSVPGGALGLRQSDAVFAHVKNLGERMELLLAQNSGQACAVGASLAPCDTAGSYMPCFLVGKMAAQAVAAALAAQVYFFSHQAGHLAAAAYGAGRLDLLDSRFLAFHISGGTTQCLLAEPGTTDALRITLLAQSLDLQAGQAVDRVAGMLGLSFPGGAALEQLAQQSGKCYSPKPTFKGMSPCLSGLENQCRDMLEKGVPTPDIAAYCLDYLAVMLQTMTDMATSMHPGLPVLFSGGVMSNRRIRARIVRSAPAALFAPPPYSADNAAGIAVLAYRVQQHQKQNGCEGGAPIAYHDRIRTEPND